MLLPANNSVALIGLLMIITAKTAQVGLLLIILAKTGWFVIDNYGQNSALTGCYGQPRRFVITYYMADDTLAIFEMAQKNNGIMPGKFLKRGKQRNNVRAPPFSVVSIE